MTQRAQCPGNHVRTSGQPCTLQDFTLNLIYTMAWVRMTAAEIALDILLSFIHFDSLISEHPFWTWEITHV